MANVPAKRLQEWLFKLMDIENIRDVRIATKGLMGIPQHFLQDDVLAAYEAIAMRAREREVDVAVHTHVNAAQQVTPLVGDAVRRCSTWGSATCATRASCSAGSTPRRSSCWSSASRSWITGRSFPYYFYMCDMIPNAEHWRLAVWEAQELQYAILGYLPGFATPRFICDVPYVGKRWVHMTDRYDRDARHLATGGRTTGPASRPTIPRRLTRHYHYYDPISTLARRVRRGGARRSRPASTTCSPSSNAEQGVTAASVVRLRFAAATRPAPIASNATVTPTTIQIADDPAGVRRRDDGVGRRQPCNLDRRRRLERPRRTAVVAGQEVTRVHVADDDRPPHLRQIHLPQVVADLAQQEPPRDLQRQRAAARSPADRTAPRRPPG